jgi:hypothetical protein
VTTLPVLVQVQPWLLVMDMYRVTGLVELAVQVMELV